MCAKPEAGDDLLGAPPTDDPLKKNNDAGADKASDEIAKPSAQRDAEEAEHPIGQCGANDTKYDVDQNARTGPHKHFGKPTC